MADIKTVLADNMRRFRKLRGISQERLGELSDLHRTYIGGIEQERINPSLKNIEKVAVALDVDPAMLLFEHPSKDPAIRNNASAQSDAEDIEAVADSQTGSQYATHYYVVEETGSSLVLRELSERGQEELGKLIEEDSKRK